MQDALARCNTAMEGHIATFPEATAAYNEYVPGWELTRKYAVSQAAIDVSAW